MTTQDRIGAYIGSSEWLQQAWNDEIVVRNCFINGAMCEATREEVLQDCIKYLLVEKNSYFRALIELKRSIVPKYQINAKGELEIL